MNQMTWMPRYGLILLVLAEVVGGGSIFAAPTQTDGANDSNIAELFATLVLSLKEIELASTSSNRLIRLPVKSPEGHGLYNLFGATAEGGKGSDMKEAKWRLLQPIYMDMRTNIVLTNLWPDVTFFRLGTWVDRDQDGLTDAFEILVSKTNPQKWDSDGGDICDADKKGPEGFMWRLEQFRHYAAIIVADSVTARPGGPDGHCTIHLPKPAPAGGATVIFHAGGVASLNDDYSLSPAGISVFIPAGAKSAALTIRAIDNKTYLDMDLYAEIRITNCTCCVWDEHPAHIDLIQTAQPGVRVFALPPQLYKPSATFGSNTSVFYFIRDGETTKPLKVDFKLSGTALNGIDYAKLPSFVIFPAGESTNSLQVTPLPTARLNQDSTIVLTLTNTPSHQIDALYGSAKILLCRVGLPPDFFDSSPKIVAPAPVVKPK